MNDILLDILVYGEAFVTDKPNCFGEYPLRFPHIQAEYECDTCPFNHTCFEETKK